MRILHWPKFGRAARHAVRKAENKVDARRDASRDTLVPTAKPSGLTGRLSGSQQSPEKAVRLDAAAACARAFDAGVDRAHADALRNALDAAFRMMPLVRRTAYVDTLARMLPRVPVHQWMATALALGEARRTLASDESWSRFDAALTGVAADSTVTQWPDLVTGLSNASPPHRDRLLHAIEQLRGALWDADVVVNALPETLPTQVCMHWTAFIDQLRDCGPLPGEQSVAVQALERLSHEEWTAFTGIMRAIGGGLNQNASRGPLMRAVSVVCATRDATARQPLVRAALELCTQGMGPMPRADILRALTPISTDQCASLPVLCAPLLARDMPPRDLAMNIVLLLETPAEARASHRDRLMAAMEARRVPGGRVDLENVSVYARIAQAARSVRALQQQVGNVDRNAALRAINQQLDAWQHHQAACPQALLRLRAGATELNNARRTLAGRRGPRDYSESLQDNQGYHVGEQVVGLGDLCAQVWVAMDRYLRAIASEEHRERERTNLYSTFFMALAQCIEDDGHRVCSVGVSQRLLQVLQGYIDTIQLDVPRPQALVCALTEALAGEAGEPDPLRLQRFVREAHERADELYGERGSDLATFDRHLREYLRLTYEFDA